MVAPGITAPWVSLTVPERPALPAWAQAKSASRISTQTAAPGNLHRRRALPTFTSPGQGSRSGRQARLPAPKKTSRRSKKTTRAAGSIWQERVAVLRNRHTSAIAGASARPIDALDAGTDAAEQFVGDCPDGRRDFPDADRLSALLPEDHDLVAGRDVGSGD